MNKVILITGASSDVGIKLIEDIHQDFDKIICHYFSDKTKLDEINNKINNKIVCIKGDFSTIDGISIFLNKLKELDCTITHVVHLAAKKSNPNKFHKVTDDYFVEGYIVGFFSIVKILQYIIPIMSKINYGKIIFMLSSFTTCSVPKFQAPYISTKYALLGLMKDISREYINKGIRVNAISPQMMETKFLIDTPQIVIEQNAKDNPFGRNLLIDEVLPVFKLLLSKESDAIVGENITISAGGF